MAEGPQQETILVTVPKTQPEGYYSSIAARKWPRFVELASNKFNRYDLDESGFIDSIEAKTTPCFC